jgi:hypothetical protein
VADPAPAANLTWTAEGDGVIHLLGSGIPGSSYWIEFAEDLPTLLWQPLDKVSADSSGVIEYFDHPPEGITRIYRTTAQ